MKKTAFLLCILTTLLFSCNNDETVIDKTTITTSDFSITMDENPENNQFIGTMLGTSNKGAVTFSLLQQSPAGAFLIDPSTGDITVANKDLFDFDTNPVLTGLVKVETQGVFETANITITLNKSLPKSLKSITLNRYNSNNQLIYWIKRTFKNEKLVEMEDILFGKSSIETYNNGLIKKREDTHTYDEYFYDANYRLIKIISDGGDGPYSYEFNYNGNDIEFIITHSINGTPNTHHLELNVDNLIYKELIPGANNQTFVSAIDYVNSNPVIVDYSDGGKDTFAYSNTVGTDAYNFYKFIYGTNWKNNLLLTRSRFSMGSHSEYVINYVSDNYITQFKKEFSDGSFFGYTVNYDFNNNSNLLKETRDFFGDPQYISSFKKVELIYEYD